MIKYFTILLLIFFCTSVSPVQAEFLQTTKPSKIQKIFPRGQLFFACTSTSALFNFLEQGNSAVRNFQSNDKACGSAPMTAVTRRNNYVTTDGRKYEIFRFLINGYDYYTYNKSKRRWFRY